MSTRTNRYLKAATFCLLSILSSASMAVSLDKVEVSADTLYLREYPTTKSRILGSLKQGDIIVTSQSDIPGWLFVDIDNTPGYISEEHVKLLHVIVSDEQITETYEVSTLQDL